MDKLKDHAAVAEMLRLMQENGRQEQAEQFSNLISAVDSIIQQNEKLFEELYEIRQQLAVMPEPEQRHTFKDAVSNAAEMAERTAAGLYSALLTIRDHIISHAETAVADFKRMGVCALDSAAYAMGVQHLLNGMSEQTAKAADSVENSIKMVEAMGQELRSAGGHLKNAGRTVSGKEAQQIDGGQEGRFQAALLAPLRAAHSTLGRIERTIIAARCASENLESAAEKMRGKREKTSVRRRLGEKKALPPPATARKHREAER